MSGPRPEVSAEDRWGDFFVIRDAVKQAAPLMSRHQVRQIAEAVSAALAAQGTAAPADESCTCLWPHSHAQGAAAPDREALARALTGVLTGQEVGDGRTHHFLSREVAASLARTLVKSPTVRAALTAPSGETPAPEADR